MPPPAYSMIKASCTAPAASNAAEKRLSSQLVAVASSEIQAQTLALHDAMTKGHILQCENWAPHAGCDAAPYNEACRCLNAHGYLHGLCVPRRRNGRVNRDFEQRRVRNGTLSKSRGVEDNHDGHLVRPGNLTPDQRKMKPRGLDPQLLLVCHFPACWTREIGPVYKQLQSCPPEGVVRLCQRHEDAR
eukprot:7390540-Prymnesium_polylepis.4